MSWNIIRNCFWLSNSFECQNKATKFESNKHICKIGPYR